MKKLILMLFTLVSIIGQVKADYFTIAGVTDIINGSNAWDPTATVNNMTKDGSVYTLVITEKLITKGPYEYKVAKNGAWEGGYPSGNQTLIIPETATYTIVYTFDGSSNLTAAITKTANGEEYTYTVSGESDLTGYDWGKDVGVNVMSSDEAVKTNYSLTLTGKALTQDVNYGFKVLQNYSLDSDKCWPSGAYNNYNVIVNPSGTYTVTFNFNVNTQTVSATAWCTDVRSIVGSFFDDGVWKTDMIMTQDPSNQNVYTLEIKGISLEAKTYEYKLRSNKKWGEYELPGDGSNKSYVCSEAGVYDLLFTANTLSNVLSLEATKVNNVPASVGSLGYATFSSAYPLDFTSVSNVKAYRVSEASAGVVKMEQVTGAVPAGYGLLLKSDGAVNTTIPTTVCTTSPGTNMLVASVTDTPLKGGVTDPYRYILAADGDEVGFYYVNKDRTSGAGKAYLESASNLTPTLSRVAMVFGDEAEATGIKELKSVKADGIFNLRGQRVMNAQKGLYIVNGKKMLMK